MKAYLYSPDKKNYPNHKGDFGLVKEAFNTKNIESIEVEELEETERAFVCIPGYDSIGHEKQINKELAKIKKVVLFVTSDECGMFNAKLIKHTDIKIWIQSPYKKHKSFFKMPIGAPTTLTSNLPEYPTKTSDMFFAGQITHQRRQELHNAIKYFNNIDYLPTGGFMQGDTQDVYYSRLSKAKIAPCPAGNVTIDSFRFYEALEMLCLPIGDIKDSAGRAFDFLDYTFDSIVPVPKTSNWNLLLDIFIKEIKDYPANMHKAVSWWIKYKRDFANLIVDQLNEPIIEIESIVEEDTNEH